MNDGLVPLMENGGGLLTEIERDRLHCITFFGTNRQRKIHVQSSIIFIMNMTKPSES